MGLLNLLSKRAADLGVNEGANYTLANATHAIENPNSKPMIHLRGHEFDNFVNDDTIKDSYDPSMKQHAIGSAKSVLKNMADYPVTTFVESLPIPPLVDLLAFPAYAGLRATEDVVRGRYQDTDPDGANYVEPGSSTIGKINKLTRDEMEAQANLASELMWPVVDKVSKGVSYLKKGLTSRPYNGK